MREELLLALALLVSDTAAGLACRLAGGLALATSAALSALAKILGFKSLDMLHNRILQKNLLYRIIAQTFV